ncbi:hypothetical protein Lupro_09365 [Lutibacter profundi]|uniref:Uncharacterized protein n=1 Tax=Lutibacter profundi TaxID=1622118 RepID=A0A0X8G7F0_9FLAO|nr:hypothetical protein [Lutibacter profundi]AMC11460.1 hypothetical protein Lupro_09365 [Lutibacter profundi]
MFILKPYVIQNLSVISTIEVSFISAFIFSFFSWVYFINTNNIDLKKWTYKKDIIRYLKVLSFTAIIFMCYVYYALHFVYISEITVDVDNFLIIGFLYVFFIGMFFYFFAKFMDYLKFSKNLTLDLLTKELEIVEQPSLIFYGKNKNEFIKTKVSNILYIQTIGHYINFF